MPASCEAHRLTPRPRLPYTQLGTIIMRMRKHMALRTVAALALVLVAAACDNDSTGPGLTGDFSGNVSGEHTKSLRGDAFFGLGSIFGEPEAGFGLLLLEGSALGDNDDFIVIGREAPGRPGVGTYQIVDEQGTPTESEFVAAWFPATGEDVDGNFYSTGGTVTITSSSTKRLRGNFEFDATGSFDSDLETLLDVTVTGTFDAVLIDENGPVTRVTNVSVRRAAVR